MKITNIQLNKEISKVTMQNDHYKIKLIYMGNYTEDKEQNNIDPAMFSIQDTPINGNRFSITISDGKPCIQDIMGGLLLTEDMVDKTISDMTFAKKTICEIQPIINTLIAGRDNELSQWVA